jgi:pimeloyl-ACP methyl ester carboxylesterase
VKEPLLLIHGFTDTAKTWDGVTPLLDPYHEVIAPTLCGHCGGPDLAADSPEPLEEMADELERTLDLAGHDQVHVVGNSLGGWLAFVLASRGRAKSVVALSPALGWDAEDPPRRTRWIFENAHRMGPWSARHAEFLARRPGLRKIAFRDVVAHPERMSPTTAYDLIQGSAACNAFETLMTHLDKHDYRAPWEKDFGIPVRIAWGERDRILPYKSCTGWHRTALPNAEWVKLPDCGHLPQHDDPELIARTILEVTTARASETVAA